MDRQGARTQDEVGTRDIEAEDVEERKGLGMERKMEEAFLLDDPLAILLSLQLL